MVCCSGTAYVERYINSIYRCNQKCGCGNEVLSSSTPTCNRGPLRHSALAWCREFPSWSTRWRADISHWGTGRVPTCPKCCRQRVPEGKAVPARCLRCPPRAVACSTKRGQIVGRTLSDLRGVRPRRGHLRLRFAPAFRRAVRQLRRRAEPPVASERTRRLLCRRSMPGVLMEPSDPDVPGRGRG